MKNTTVILPLILLFVCPSIPISAQTDISNRDWIAFIGGGSDSLPQAVYRARLDGSAVQRVSGSGVMDFFPKYDPETDAVFVLRFGIWSLSPSQPVFGRIDVETGVFSAIYPFENAVFDYDVSVHYSPSLRYVLFQYSFESNAFSPESDVANQTILYDRETSSARTLNAASMRMAYTFLCYSPNERIVLTYRNPSRDSDWEDWTTFYEFDLSGGAARFLGRVPTRGPVSAVYRPDDSGNFYFSYDREIQLWHRYAQQGVFFGRGNLIPGSSMSPDGTRLMSQILHSDYGILSVYEHDTNTGRSTEIMSFSGARYPGDNIYWLDNDAFLFDLKNSYGEVEIIAYSREDLWRSFVPSVRNGRTSGRWQADVTEDVPANDTGYELPACPFVDVRTEAGFERQGAILVDRCSPELEATQALELTKMDASDGIVTVRIVEEEPETTYLDCVALMTDGRVFLPVGASDELSANDGRRLALRQGDSIVLMFDLGFRPVSCVLIVRGYYVPD